MNRQRRQRLEAVIHPLVGLEHFSTDEAKRYCSESSPAYVTRTLRQLVRDGLLKKTHERGRVIYRWQWQASSVESTRRWIDRQLSTRPDASPADLPIERLMRLGADALSDEDLLSILLPSSHEPAQVAAHRISHQFASRWHELPDCTPDELRAITPNATRRGYVQIMAGIELGRRISLAERPFAATAGITSSGQAIEFCRHAFRRLAVEGVQEEFHLVTLDTKHKPIGTHRVTVGTLDASLVHPREVFRPAIRHAAAAVLLVHNHPSGDPTPSREDRLVTEQLTEAGKLLGIQVLDHIVVARTDCVSVREV